MSNAKNNDVILDEVRGESETRKEAGLTALPLRIGAFNEVIRQDNKLERHFVDAVN